MGKKLKKLMKKQGFTLVELIIVIAIISILAVAAFMMLTKWLANSRDSRRLSDLDVIKKSLELGYIELGHYPDPDGEESVLDSNGVTMWYIGYIGENVIEKTSALVKAPVDPSDSSSFNYAITLDKQEYQVGVLLEKGTEATFFSNNIYAGQRRFTEEDIGKLSTNIDGAYDGYVTYSTGDTIYIVSTESLLVYSGNTVDTDGENVNLMIDGALLGEETVLVNLPITPDMSNDIIIVRAKEVFGLTGGNIEGDELAINIVENNTTIDLVPIQYEHCNLNGTLIAHGDSIDTYSSVTVPFDNSCEDIKTSRLCDDGTLSAGPDFQSCTMEGALDCSLDGTAVAHGDSINAYSESNIVWDASYDCNDRIESRNCYNGTLDGSYSNLTCAKGTPNNCDANVSYSYNGHTYNVSQLNHGETDTPTVDVSENNGTYRYTLSATCNDGTYNESETGPDLVNCDTNYTASGNNCSADNKTTTCGGSIASNEEWNTSNDYIQTWNGNIWVPTKTANYDENPSIDDCRYRCKVNYTWNGSTCDANTKSVTCGGSIVANATASTATTYTQTWNGSIWTPTTSWGEDQAICDFDCNTNYTWDGDSCEADGRTVTCSGTIPANSQRNSSNTYSQLRNGTVRTPTKSVNYNVTTTTNDCRYKCNTSYHTEDSGNTCVSDTRTCSITNGAGSQIWNGSSWNACVPTSCNTDFYSNGSSCVAVGTGYYSANGSLSRVQCTNHKPNYSNYTSAGNGSNNCSWACRTSAYLNGNVCERVGNSYYSPNNDNNRYGCTNRKPNYSNYTNDGNGSNSCSWACQTDRRWNGSSCARVGNGLYSRNNDNNRYRCTNRKPNYSNYTSAGNGTNSCSRGCRTSVYWNGSACARVGNSYYSPNNNNSRYGCTNRKPANSYYSSDGSNGTNSCNWTCNSGYTRRNGACRICVSGWSFSNGVCYKTISNPMVLGYRLGAGMANNLWIDSGDHYCNQFQKAGSKIARATQNLCGPYKVRFDDGRTARYKRDFGCNEHGGASSITCKYTP